ncbi:MAG: hypothetical protein JEY79_07020 [Pseudodesulfovibrio sp.]|nr:hypothetical protein [Pseudodesulfovibrio sp.]
MRRFNKIAIFIVTVVLLTAALALAGTKFKNEDTAVNRQNNTFGTDSGENTSTTTFATNNTDDTTIKTKARHKKEPVDWYDKIIITVDPDTTWP